jgi:phage-related minor tail protein
MASKKVNGITIAINADTSGVTAGLKDLTTQSVSLTKQLKSVDALLKLDPTNTELLDTKQKLLADSVDTTRKRLEALRGAQEDVKRAVESGSIGTDEYIAFQRELVETEKRMKDLEGATDDTGDEMKDTEKEASKFGDTLKSGLAAGAKVAAAAVAAVAAAAAATAAKLIDAAGDTAEYGDNIDKMSQKLGMSAEAYQEWDFIMQHSGSDIDKMSTSMKKLADAVQDPSKDAAAAFERLGISLEEAKNLSQEDLFAKTITALQGLESGTERTALANDLLGKSAMDLGALLNTSAEDTEAMRQQVHELGGVMSDEAVKASAAYKDSLQNMKTAVQGAGRSLVSDFMPSITQIMDGVSMLVSGQDGSVEALTEGFESFINNLENSADKLTEVAEKIIPIFADAIIKAAPIIIKSAGRIVLNLAKGLIMELPSIIKIGADIIVKLVQGIADALPDLIPVAIEAVLQIAKTLTDPKTLMPLIQAAFQIINALIDGLLSAESINAMVEALPEIVTNIVDILIDSIDLLLDASIRIIEALCDYFFEPKNLAKIIEATVKIIVKLVEGLIEAVWRLGEAAATIVSTLTGKLAEMWEKIKQAGRDIIDQLMAGITEKWDEWSSWWEGIGEFIYDKLHPGAEDGYIDESKVWYPEPAMATGGIVTRPTRALIGEAGAEAVLPLERNTGWIDLLASKLNGAGAGGGDIYITVNAPTGNAPDIVRALDEAFRNQQIAQARSVGGTGWK